MSNSKKAKIDLPLPKGLNRVPAEEFIQKLADAEEWMLWVNPAFEEVELIIMENDMPSVFHGPDPMSMGFTEYKDFAAQVDAISAVKD
jgi:hypothetical protein